MSHQSVVSFQFHTTVAQFSKKRVLRPPLGRTVYSTRPKYSYNTH